MSLKEPGFYEISGVAYSGTGRIAKVMVSADGGKSWGEAALQAPVSKAFTRFRDAVALGRPAGGAAEPRLGRSRQRAAAAGRIRRRSAARPRSRSRPRSAFPNQHYNSITSWGIDGKGEIKHVYA